VILPGDAEERLEKAREEKNRRVAGENGSQEEERENASRRHFR